MRRHRSTGARVACTRLIYIPLFCCLRQVTLVIRRILYTVIIKWIKLIIFKTLTIYVYVPRNYILYIYIYIYAG